MRAYNLQGVWVDLDSILSIQEPFFEVDSSGANVVTLRWQHTFRDKPSSISWSQPMMREATMYDHRAPVYLPVGDPVTKEPTMVVIVRERIFQPFFTAWRLGPGAAFFQPDPYPSAHQRSPKL